ncbi:Uncharacterised protein [Mycobacteroides abscessus subsp. abscessus]|nr:Uncharacterised protein [Mycobacteroides abscessus subsp. abscessus]
MMIKPLRKKPQQILKLQQKQPQKQQRKRLLRKP